MLIIVYRIFHRLPPIYIIAPPDAPVNLQVTTVSTDSISIMWLLGDNGGSSVIGITVEYQPLTSQVSDGGNHTLAKNATSFTIPGLQPNTAYEIRVYARNDVGVGRPAILNTHTLRLRE